MSNPTPPTDPAARPAPVSKLAELSEKARDAQRTVEAGLSQDRQKLSAAVADAKDKAEQGAQRLKASGEQTKGHVTGAWNQVQTSWQEHVTAVRDKIEERKEERDVKRLRKAADDAEDYASDAISFAIAAVEEAEYATLDAVLARAEADDATEAAE
ncbi:hypothetical protein [Streptomyces sp. NPDC048282]|uniref:hypothetical protein n=1 Tax=unclassified Streptomyces TaxID=2593676 RepID=UPI0037135341